MSNKTEHIPTPYRVVYGMRVNPPYISGPGALNVCELFSNTKPVTDATAEYIVKACNAYPELIETVQGIMDAFTIFLNNKNGYIEEHHFTSSISKARLLLNRLNEKP